LAIHKLRARRGEKRKPLTAIGAARRRVALARREEA
jgi:hypothetical protein